MHKLFSEIIGLPVYDEYSPSPIAFVQDLIIDPENGKVLAFLVKGRHIIVPLDVERISAGIFIRDREHILPISEVLRVQSVLNLNIDIINSKVFTEKRKEYIGRSVDYEIDTRDMILSRIHTAKTFFFFRFQERVIPYKQIVKIEKRAIFVKDNYATAKEKSSVRESAFAA
ncbi:MAG: PRC-barrel domain-containing protein [Candidatus Gracilibacteria bacterium]|jgi:sporulation protein YlmC with PRC-barrel domain